MDSYNRQGISQESNKSRIYPSLEDTPEFQEAIEKSKSAEVELAELRRGCTLWKIRSCDKWYPRRYWLDADHLRLCYEPSHKPFWSNANNYVDVIDINDVRLGWKTDVFNRAGRQAEKHKAKNPTAAPILIEKNCFSIIYGRLGKTLDLVAPDENTASRWVRGLRYLKTVVRTLHREKEYEEWLQLQFRQADKNHSGALNFEECLKLLKLLNIKLDPVEAKKLFQLSNTNKKTVKGEQVIDAQEFIAFYQLLMKRPELETLFKRYVKENYHFMTAAELKEFLEKEQFMEDIDNTDAQALIHKFELSPAKSKDVMTLAGFTALMTSDKFHIMETSHREVYQDMDQPLSHYYIASSHNTYLMGNQLTSESSVEAYISALEQGCRCLELDVWDGPNGEPRIYHGRTITGQILVKDVLSDAIKPYAFKTSPFPLILSIENHLSADQQDTLARHLKEILGDFLYVKNVSDMTTLPSPNELKYKVIIKAKKVLSSTELMNNTDDPADSSLKSEDNEEDMEESFDQEMQINSPDNEIRQQSITNVKTTQIISEALSGLVNICQGMKFKGFQNSRSQGKCYHVSSLSEGKATLLINELPGEFVEHTSRQLVRIYPAGSRTGSSNYSPIPFWNFGCQIVALNYQTFCKEKIIYLGKFRHNGNCGYILKPGFLTTGLPYNPLEQDKLQKYIEIRIISGHNLPKAKEKPEDVVDPYVSVQIQGHPADYYKYKTKHISNNGFNPNWNETCKSFLRVPELAVVLFMVKDKNKISSSKFIGSYALPFFSIKQGYCHVPLMTTDGDYSTSATLFLHIRIGDIS